MGEWVVINIALKQEIKNEYCREDLGRVVDVMNTIEAAMCKAQVKELKDKQKQSLITFIQGKDVFISSMI